jgi:hypothetical protein
MSSTESGDAGTVSNSLAATVTNATNATPIVITTSAAHLFADNDYVIVASVGGNTAANGTWKITWLSGTTFSLDTSVGNGAYTSGGTATDISLTPQFTIPADGDDLDAASVNVALEALADRTQFLALRVQDRTDDFIASGTWTCPPGVTSVDVEAWGAGGSGGGAGPAGTGSGGQAACGGGGGGGAQRKSRRLVVVPATVYTITVAPATTGGAASTSGSDGGTTSFGVLAEWDGGGKGLSSADAAVAAERAFHGGGPVPMPTAYAGRVAIVDQISLVGRSPGCGGAGLGGASSVSHAGTQSVEGHAGGAGALYGIASGITYAGGGPGGGGGGGPGGVGGAGGAGGNGNNGGTGVAGTSGTAAAANTGAGGGGGGAGGAGSAAGGAAGTGGAGGSGWMRIAYRGPQAVVT